MCLILRLKDIGKEEIRDLFNFKNREENQFKIEKHCINLYTFFK